MFFPFSDKNNVFRDWKSAQLPTGLPPIKCWDLIFLANRGYPSCTSADLFGNTGVKIQLHILLLIAYLATNMFDHGRRQ